MLPYRDNDPVLEVPAYSLASAARYLRITPSALREWLVSRNRSAPLIRIAEDDPPALSFANLLECHVVKALRVRMSMENVRNGIETAARIYDTRHPLLDPRARTDGRSLFFQTEEGEDAGVVNVSQGGQVAMRPIIWMFLKRINWDDAKFFPFVREISDEEPRIVSIGPRVASGRSVIDGTGISTAVIASRFAAREKPSALAREYGLEEEQIYEAIRWERPYRAAA